MFFALYHIASNMKEIELTFEKKAPTFAFSTRLCYALLEAPQNGEGTEGGRGKMNHG